jgi:hypothetical protein
MTNTDLIKIKQPNALAICEGIEFEEEATALLNYNPTVINFIDQLIEQQLYTDAVRFLGHALPKREATWWACLCARKGFSDSTPEYDIKAVELAEAWVYQPIEEKRKVILPVAEVGGFKSAASWAAMAAVWSGNDISPIPEAVIPPDEKLYAKAVVGAVMLSATQGEASKVNENYKLFLKQGLHIASGGDGRNI